MSVRKRKWTTAKGASKEAWVVDYVDQNGKRRLKTFTKKKDADGWRSTADIQVREGTHTPASESKTIAEAMDAWIDHCEAEGLEFGTIKQRREHLRLHVDPYIGKVKLSDLTAPRVNLYIDKLRDEGRSLSMRRKVLTNIKTMLTFAMGRGWVAQNVAREIRIADRKRDDDRELHAGVDMPTKAELRVMMDKAPTRWRAFVLMAVFSGMRASELRGLRWADVDLAAGIIRVRQRADAWGKVGSPKSAAGRREIPVPPVVVSALQEWKLGYPRPLTGDKDAAGNAVREPYRPEHLVFPNGQGKVENLGNIINRFFNPLQIDNGIAVPAIDDDGKPKLDKDGEPVMRAKYGLHALRHAAVSLFIELGWTPKKVQTVIGHSSIHMTFDRYGKLFPDQEGDRAAMDRLQGLL